MSAQHKLEILRAVEGSGLPKSQVLAQLGIASSTYYRWRVRFRREGTIGLVDRPAGKRSVWNRVLPEERAACLRSCAAVSGVVIPRVELSYQRQVRVFGFRIHGVSPAQGARFDQTRRGEKPSLPGWSTRSKRAAPMNSGRPMRRTCWSRTGDGTT